MQRKKLLLNVACAAVLAAVPATAAAHGDHGDDGEDGTHGEVVGTVASFSNSTLTINLADGSTMTGKVTERTDVECKGDNGLRRRGSGSRLAHTARHGADDNGDDDSRGDRRGDDGDRHDRGDRRGHRRGSHTDCGTAALVAGAKVHEAELRGTTAGAVFKEIELVS
jgi:hypothetical protein